MLFDTLGKMCASSFFDRPVFVIGCSRSGTSVLLQALGRHKQLISAPGEAPFLTSIGGAVHLYEAGKDADYYNRSLNVPKPYLYDCLKRLGFETAAGKNYGLKTFVKTCLERRRLVRPYRWCAKTFPPKQVSDALRLLYPEARFVYIMRNGLEVVRSMTKYEGFRDRHFEQHCRAWADSMEKYEYLLDYPSSVCVRHEELRTDPQVVFEKIFTVLDLLFDDAVVEFVKNTVVHPLDRDTANNTDANTEFAKRPAPYDAWNAKQRELFLEICGDEMRKAAYEIPYIS